MRATAPWRGIEAGVAACLIAATVGTARADPADGATPNDAAAPLIPVVVGVVLNGTLVADSQLVHLQNAGERAQVWLPQLEALSWRMKSDGRERRTIEGTAHIAFCNGPGAAARDRCFYDESNAVLTMSLQSEDLLLQRIAPADVIAPDLSEPRAAGAYLNYDVSAWHVGGNGLSAQLDGRVYTAQGHGAMRFDGIYTGDRGRYTWMAGVWQIDRPQQGVSYQLGNISVPDTTMGLGLPMLGVRVGSNASLQPSALTTLRPLVTMPAGERSLRTDVFVDGLYRQTAEVPYGPYSVEVMPLYPGRGQLDIVTTDVSEQQRRISVPFYQAGQMLAPGAQVWSLDAGLLQDTSTGIGATRTRGSGVFSAALRQGLDRHMTGQAQALVTRGAARAALAVDAVHPLYGLASLGLLGQRSELPSDAGLWLALGHEYLSRSASGSVHAEQAVRGCKSAPASSETGTAAPLADRLMRPCRRLEATVGADIGPRWSLSAATSAQTDAQGLRNAVSYVGARLQSDSRSQLGLSMQWLHTAGGSSRTVLVSWSQPLGSNWTGQVGAQRRGDGAASLQWSVQSVAPVDEPALNQVQVYGSTGAQGSVGGRYAERGTQADWRAEARATQHGAQGSLGLAGAVGSAAGRLFAARRIDDAFVLVDVGLAGLPVLLDNREVARTNAAGWAVVTEVRAFQNNAIGVDTSALPIQYSMPRDQQVVVPGGAAGVLAQFDVSDGGIALPVADAEGKRLPAGAQARVSGQRLPTAVTTAGEIFIDRSDRAADVIVNWGTNGCHFRYDPQTPQRTYTCNP